LNHPAVETEHAWLRERPGSPGRVRLVCFPHAGAGASAYLRWHEPLAPDLQVVAVQLPGREDRIREPGFRRLGPLVDALVPALDGALRGPFAFFGHSMGALIAYEVARRLAALGRPGPLHLFVSGRAAPGARRRDMPIARLPDEDLRAALRRLNGLPAQVAREPELMALVTATLRADLELVENHTHAPGPRLRIPVTAFGGADDDVWRSDLSRWRDTTEAEFRMRVFPGGHFFVVAQRHRVLDAIRSDLQASIGRGSAPRGD
jgi:medium-chain acyl-[acyl-carrier-protein] hydrolase